MLGTNLTQAFIPSVIKWSALGPAGLTFARCALAAGILLGLARARGARLMGRRVRFATLACGLLLAAHWALFIAAVKTTTVAVAQVTLFTFPLMTSLLEPLLERRPPRTRQVLASLAALAGVAALQDAEGWSRASLAGGTLSLLSAACFTVRSVITRRLVRGSDGVALMGWQAAVAGAVILPFAGAPAWPASKDLLVVLLFGTLFTAWPHTVFVRAMAHLPAATAGLLTTLQVPLSVGIAWVWPGEAVRPVALLGLALVVGAVAVESRAHWRSGPQG